MGRAYKALEIDAKRDIDIGNRLPLKIYEKGEGDVKLGRYGFVPKVSTEERMMDFLKRFVGGKKYY